MPTWAPHRSCLSGALVRIAWMATAAVLVGASVGVAEAAPLSSGQAVPGATGTGTSGASSPTNSRNATFGPLTLVLTNDTVTSSFTLATPARTTFARVQTAVRPASAPDSTDGRLDFGSFTDVTVYRTRTLTASTTLAPGDYIARSAYLLDGRWVDGEDRVSFTISAPTPATQTAPDRPAPARPTPGRPAPTQPAPTQPAPTQPAPVRPPGNGPVSVGSMSGFSPGGDFPFLPDAQLAHDLDGVVATGATWVRVDFPWSTMEPTKGDHQWGNLDRVTAAAAARGLKVLALPAYSPAWARPGCRTDKCPPADPADFAAFVAAAGRHFGPDRVQAWELWNEPNIAAFWAPKPDTAAYAVLLAKAAAALRAARPDAFILSAGLSPAYSDGTSVAPVDFVRRLYALGAMRHVDAVAIHPYSDKDLPLTSGTESWNTFLQMETVHNVMVANGDGAKQVWGTEFGVATGASSQSTSEAKQAAVIEQGFQRLGDGTWPWLGPLFAYSLRDSADDISNWQSNFGLLRHDGSPKPAYTSFKTAMKLPLAR